MTKREKEKMREGRWREVEGEREGERELEREHRAHDVGRVQEAKGADVQAAGRRHGWIWSGRQPRAWNRGFNPDE